MTRPADAPELAEHPAVFRGGPWNDWWLAGASFLNNRQAARHMGHTPAVLQGASLGYEPSEQFVTGGTDRTATVEGRIWQWRPNTTTTNRSAA